MCNVRGNREYLIEYLAHDLGVYEERIGFAVHVCQRAPVSVLPLDVVLEMDIRPPGKKFFGEIRRLFAVTANRPFGIDRLGRVHSDQTNLGGLALNGGDDGVAVYNTLARAVVFGGARGG